MLTYQQMFDRAFIGLRSQNFVPSYTYVDGCRYNGLNKCHCCKRNVGYRDNYCPYPDCQAKLRKS